MKLSMKSDYALRAILTLVDSHEAGPRGIGPKAKAVPAPVPIRELARRNDVPKKFLEHIMLELKSQGWVRSVPGTRGGYILAKSPDQITMGQIVRHFDGLLAPIACVSASHYVRCSQEPVCRFRRVLLEIRNYTVSMMDRATLASIAAGNPVTEQEVFHDELVGGAGI